MASGRFQMEIFIGALGMALVAPVHSQNDKSTNKQQSVLLTGLPDFLQPQIGALGNRVKAPGKESTVFEGTFTIANGKPKTAHIVMQLPGSVELKGFHGDETTLKFEGSSEPSNFKVV